jgi:hypothetical protein
VRVWRNSGGKMATKKDRRSNGYYTPTATISPKDQKELFINPEYDDWNDHRDGFRDWFRDFKLIKKAYKKRHYWSDLIEKRTRMNEKQEKLLQRRKAKKKRVKNKPAPPGPIDASDPGWFHPFLP